MGWFARRRSPGHLCWLHMAYLGGQTPSPQCQGGIVTPRLVELIAVTLGSQTGQLTQLHRTGELQGHLPKQPAAGRTLEGGIESR